MVKRLRGRPPIEDEIKKRKVTITLSPEEIDVLDDLARMKRQAKGIIVGDLLMASIARERKKRSGKGLS